MTYEQLLKEATEAYNSLSPEEKLERDAEQAVSFAYHCAKSFRAEGGTFEEFAARYGDGLKRQYLASRRG